MNAPASIRPRQNGRTSETACHEAEVTFSNGVSFLVIASDRHDGATMFHIPADENNPDETRTFSITPGAVNTIFLTAEKRKRR